MSGDGVFDSPFCPGGGILYTMIVPGGGFLPHKSRARPGGMLLDEIDSYTISY